MVNKSFWMVIVLAFGMVLIGCDIEPTESKETPKSIDIRLVGGKWYDGAAGTQNAYYRFTTSDIFTATNGPVSEIAVAAYTENGQVKTQFNGTVLYGLYFYTTF
jgi:hypothetical protein